jgi:membrane-bound lytic murein transglycosylase B
MVFLSGFYRSLAQARRAAKWRFAAGGTVAGNGCLGLAARGTTRRMISRRTLLAAAPAFAACSARAATPEDGFARFVAGVKAEALRKGISSATLEAAFAGVRMNPRVIELDRHQPEFSLTWEQYRARIVSDTRVAKGRQLYAQNRALLREIGQRYGVSPGVLMGIWGLESNYGVATGGFNVIEALATLAWDTRRPAFFRSELFDALRILQHGDIAPAQMTGSYAGAMGQTQFMPDSFLRYAVDYSGNGRRDIWGDLGDVFASTANYLAREGWRGDLSWGTEIALPAGFAPGMAGREHRRSVAEWERLGVRPLRGELPRRPEAMAAVILPGGIGGGAYLAYHPNFQAIRRYNPSDFYCISVGLIGDAVTA